MSRARRFAASAVEADDVVLVILIGHGHGRSDGDEAKFNLVGPDLEHAEWAELLKPVAGRLVFVNTSGGSFPFLKALAARGRIVLTATDTAGQQFETVFAEFFVKAHGAPAADCGQEREGVDTGGVRLCRAPASGWFDEKGQLATERPALDDTGDGATRSRRRFAGKLTYLQPDVRIPPTADAELTGLIRRRAELESEVERLRPASRTCPGPVRTRAREAPARDGASRSADPLEILTDTRGDWTVLRNG